MSINDLPLSLNLQLFADGGSAGAGAASSGTSAEGSSAENAGVADLQKGVKNPLANVKYGIQDSAEAQTTDVRSNNDGVDRNAEFEALIKGEYKDLYDARMQDTIQKRLKGTKETVDKYNALAPTLDTLARKYGVDANDIEALNKAIEEDDAYFEDEALEKGITVDQLKSIRKMERENADLKKQMQEQATKEQSAKIYASWMQQADAMKSIYPTFNLQNELQNPKFTDLIKNNVDVRTAFEVIHKDDIMRSALQFTAKTVEQKMTNKIRSAGARPVENGISSQSSVITKSDVSQLSKADREEIIRRVARGEKIRF